MDKCLFQSLIDVDLWNDAQWTATAFLHDPDGAKPPCIGLVFGNTMIGRKIFEGLRSRLGEIDRFEELYVSIIEGEILGEKSGYTVHLSSDPLRTEARLHADGTPVTFDSAVILSRYQRMIPEAGSLNLARFKSHLKVHQKYFIIPVSSDIQPQFDYAIEKREIHLREASEITGQDRDAVIFPANYFENKSVN